MTSKTVIRGAYLSDLLQQPAAVEATLTAIAEQAMAADEALVTLADRDFERIVLTGMGSSLAALHPLAIRLIEHGIAAIIVDTSELIHAMAKLLDADNTLIIAVSQSGRSAESVRLVEILSEVSTLTKVSKRARGATPLIAVTNTPGSPLAVGADAIILTHAGTESTVSCKTYVATLAALAFLGDILCDDSTMRDLAAAPAAMSAYLDRWEDHVAALAPVVDGVRDIFFAGRGASVAAAYTAGLIVKESTRYHAEGMTSAALRHGPMEMAADHVLALVYEGDAKVAALNAALVRDLRKAGARAHLAGKNAELDAFRLPDAPPALRPLLEILPAQMLSLTLAAQAGIEAGLFLHATKVTATE